MVISWRRYINMLTLGFLIFGATLTLIVIFMSPEQGYISFGPFFLSFFLMLVCAFSLVGFYFRRKVSNNELLYYNLKTAFRQAVLVSLYLTLVLIMKAAGLLNWWDALLLGVSLLFFDMFFKEKV